MMNVLILLVCLYNVTGFLKPLHESYKTHLQMFNKYPLSKLYYEGFIRQTNSNNGTMKNNEISNREYNHSLPRVRIILNKNMFSEFYNPIGSPYDEDEGHRNEDNQENGDKHDDLYKGFFGGSTRTKKSKNFQIETKMTISFNDIGGYDSIKSELRQCIDLLRNYTKYSRFNVRVPKGLIFEGPPGNGKTLLAKSLAKEADCAFIAVSGSEFQEKYVGVGASRIRELFKFASENIPCIIFIDEIDALGRSRGKDSETANSERDNTLNELLVALDGYKNTSGIFVIGATNRADLLDSALLRPGRIDKRIFIGNPDSKTRESIINIHIRGKPYTDNVIISDLVDLTSGLSGAQIENLLNEAMLNALRNNIEQFTNEDIEHVYNKMLVGWQPTDHQFTSDIIDHIAIHELGHVIVGLLSKHHAKVSKVMINLSAPKSPAYTVFEPTDSAIFTREALFEHLMILLAGRIAEEVFYGVSVTTGAINDFEEAHKLAEKMVLYYGMGKKIIYPSFSEKYKEMIDNEVATLLHDAYSYSTVIIQSTKDFINEGAELLKDKKIVYYNDLITLIHEKYSYILNDDSSSSL